MKFKKLPHLHNYFPRCLSLPKVHTNTFLSEGAHCYGQGAAYFPSFCLQVQWDGDTGAPQKETDGPEIQYSACDLFVQRAEPFTIHLDMK